MPFIYQSSYGLVFVIIFTMLSCDSGPIEFNSWYADQKQLRLNSVEALADTAEFYSSDLLIDKIYRSMQGPYENKNIQIEEESNELLWIVGYESKVIQAESDIELGSAFMCHNNLDYADPKLLPWKLKTSGENHRIFTLSQGQSELRFPEGFGIPIPANLPLRMVSQVLNHHRPELFINTRHDSQIHYYKQTELNHELKALYQQAVYIRKPVDSANYYSVMPKSCVPVNAAKTDRIDQSIVQEKHLDAKQMGNIYEDEAGQKYTGHWVLPNEPETLKTDVSGMLDLNEDSRIHMISVHLHPFAEAMELWDKTTDSLLYAASFKKDSLNFGFVNMDYYSSEIGIPVYKDHAYELVSAYHCTDTSDQHTAMAVMYLYLRE